jgi:hypothetical protein
MPSEIVDCTKRSRHATTAPTLGPTGDPKVHLPVCLRPSPFGTEIDDVCRATPGTMASAGWGHGEGLSWLVPSCPVGWRDLHGSKGSSVGLAEMNLNRRWM